MSVFVIRNQHKHYLGKHGEWLDGSHPTALFRTTHRDVAVNELIDHNIRDVELRGEILDCEADASGHPLVEVLNPIPVALPGAEPEISLP
jgi:hypothetical protein